MTTIEWTEETWNPVVGCSVVSPGCTHCYAMKMANRLSFNPSTPQYHGTVKGSRGGPVWTGKMALVEKALTEPLRRKKPTIYFVNSMGDLFHENALEEWIDQVFVVMALCPQHTFQVLTKRSQRMREYVSSAEARVMDRVCDTVLDIGLPVALSAVPQSDEKAASFGKPVVRLYQWPLPNVWLGVSAEDQQRANERVPDLVQTPAAVHFISAEPLLGPIDFEAILTPESWGPNPEGWTFNAFECGDTYHLKMDGSSDTGDGPYREYMVDQIIVGGESGSNARPMHPDWARQIRDDCIASGTRFFFKQWGSWGPDEYEGGDDPVIDGRAQCAALRDDGKWEVHETGYAVPDKPFVGEWVYKLGKKRAGRLLDGREWNEVPA